MLEQQGTLHKFQSKFVLFHYYFYYYSFLIVTLNSKDLFVLKKRWFHTRGYRNGALLSLLLK